MSRPLKNRLTTGIRVTQDAANKLDEYKQTCDKDRSKVQRTRQENIAKQLKNPSLRDEEIISDLLLTMEPPPRLYLADIVDAIVINTNFSPIDIYEGTARAHIMITKKTFEMLEELRKLRSRGLEELVTTDAVLRFLISRELRKLQQHPEETQVESIVVKE